MDIEIIQALCPLYFTATEVECKVNRKTKSGFTVRDADGHLVMRAIPTWQAMIGSYWIVDLYGGVNTDLKLGWFPTYASLRDVKKLLPKLQPESQQQQQQQQHDTPATHQTS